MTVSPRSLFFLGGLLAGLALSACPGDTLRETCGDGLDNDGNGLTDCDDPDCTGQTLCVDLTNYGSCAKCGKSCTAQPACVTDYVTERPIPYCLEGKCWATNTFIQPRVFIDTKDNWNGLANAPQSGTTRFIKKQASDGSAVTCATVAAAAADRSKPSAIEASGKFVIQGMDVTRVQNPNLSQGITYTFVNTQIGGDFLIWTELWAGPPDSLTKMPQGFRQGYGCYEDAATVGGPLLATDGCPSTVSDAGTCRVFRLVMPPPEQ